MERSGGHDHQQIRIRGAREHNLRNVDLELPRDKLIVFTGLSGSGKSSLAFDTIYAEGQRRYVESLSAYAAAVPRPDGQARRRLHRGPVAGDLDRPEVGVAQPAIDGRAPSPRSTTTCGCSTPRIGVPHCPNCGRVITRQTPQQIVDRVLQLAEGTRFQVLAPVVRGRKGEYEGLLKELASQGFTRARVDGELVELGAATSERLARYENHTIEVVVDRLVRRTGDRTPPHRLAGDRAAPGRGCRRGRDRAARRRARATSRPSCSPSTWRAPHCGVSFDELAPRNFSFNSPYGACERCDGLGTRFEVDPELARPRRRPQPPRRCDRAVVGVPQSLLRAGARLRRRRVRLLHRHRRGRS